MMYWCKRINQTIFLIGCFSATTPLSAFLPINEIKKSNKCFGERKQMLGKATKQCKFDKILPHHLVLIAAKERSMNLNKIVMLSFNKREHLDRNFQEPGFSYL